jgi:hypothetical protein
MPLWVRMARGCRTVVLNLSLSSPLGMVITAISQAMVQVGRPTVLMAFHRNVQMGKLYSALSPMSRPFRTILCTHFADRFC